MAKARRKQNTNSKNPKTKKATANTTEKNPETDGKQTGKIKTNFKWDFEFSLLNSAGKEVEKVNSTVETIADSESEAFRAALKLAEDKYKTDRLIYTQNFKRIKL